MVVATEYSYLSWQTSCWSIGRGVSRREWLLAAAPALAFSALHLAIWSLGLTLYLPWPLYAQSLWLAGVTALAVRRRGEPAGWSMRLLLAGG